MKKKDIFGVEPELDDLIVFNPPKYKGLIITKCIGFSPSGSPEVERVDGKWIYGAHNLRGRYTPKTDFVVHKQ